MRRIFRETARFRVPKPPKVAPLLGFRIDLPCIQGYKIQISSSILPIIAFFAEKFPVVFPSCHTEFLCYNKHCDYYKRKNSVCTALEAISYEF
jgi:hypothetical protein